MADLSAALGAPPKRQRVGLPSELATQLQQPALIPPPAMPTAAPSQSRTPQTQVLQQRECSIAQMQQQKQAHLISQFLLNTPTAGEPAVRPSPPATAGGPVRPPTLLYSPQEEQQRRVVQQRLQSCAQMFKMDATQQQLLFDKIARQPLQAQMHLIQNIEHRFAEKQARAEEARRAEAEKQRAAEARQREEDGILDATPGASGANDDALELQLGEEEAAKAAVPVFATYRPLKVRYGKHHPAPIVESCTMASVVPPDATYEPELPLTLLRGERGREHASAGWGRHAEGALSEAQLEALVYAGQRHTQTNADGTRAGFFVGDGTGVGKGREIAAVMLDNWRRGRRRHIWCSTSTALLHDARRDFADLGRPDVPIHPLHRQPYGELPAGVGDGIMFVTYQSLIAQNKKNERRLDQLVAWACGSDMCEEDEDEAPFEGVLVFDEAHRAKNLAPSLTGTRQGSKTAGTVLAIQEMLPGARVMYVSATAAVEVKDLGYMHRLGLWGKSTPFADFPAFVGAIDKAGVGAM